MVAIASHHGRPEQPAREAPALPGRPGAAAASGVMKKPAGPRRGPKQPATAPKGYKGVAWDAEEGSWRVRISEGGKQHHVARFADEEEAAQAFDVAALILSGPSAAVNFGPARALRAAPQLLKQNRVLRRFNAVGRRRGFGVAAGAPDSQQEESSPDCRQGAAGPPPDARRRGRQARRRAAGLRRAALAGGQ